MSIGNPRCLCCSVKLEVEKNRNGQTSENSGVEIINESVLDFHSFCIAVGISKPSGISCDFELEKDEEYSTFCSTCSEVIQSLVALQELLEKTKLSIQEKLGCIRNTVEIATLTEKGFTEEFGEEEEDPRISYIRLELLLGSKRTFQSETVEAESADFNLRVDRSTLCLENELEVKLESPDLTEYAEPFEGTEFQFEDFEEHTPGNLGLEESIIFPHSSNSVTEQVTVSNVEFASEEADVPVASKRCRVPRGRRRKYCSKVSIKETLKDSVHIVTGRPSRKKRKSYRLMDLENISITVQDGITHMKKVKHHLSPSDKVLLKSFGLDKLPELRIQLEDVFSKRLAVKVDTQSNTEMELEGKNEEFGPKPSTRYWPTSRRRISETMSKLRLDQRKCVAQIRKRLTTSPSSLTNQENSNLEQSPDSDFLPTSESDDPNFDSDYLSDAGKSKSKYRSNYKRKGNGRATRTKRKVKPDESANDSSIVIENGRRYYRRQEIVEEGDYWLCAFKTVCDFKTLKDDDQSCDSMLQHFINVHANDSKFRCKICDTFCHTKRGFWKHRAEFHPRALTKECEICQKPLSVKTNINNHLWSHLNNEERADWIAAGKKDPREWLRKSKEKKHSHQCAKCGKLFPNPSDLKIHEKVHIDINLRPKIICEKCGDVFTTKRGLYYHSIRIHNPEEFLSKWKFCMICDQKFYMQNRLNIHMRVDHGAEKVHKCNKCDKTFTNKHALNCHAVLHLPLPDQRPYKCPFCDSAYRYRNSLYRHIGKAHKDKNFVRSTAPRMPKNLTSNRKLPPVTVMTCQRMYPCEICEKPFALPSRLTKHMKASHIRA